MSSSQAAGHRERILVQVTVDLVILTVRDETLQVLLVERGNEPFPNKHALPGGFLRPAEDALTAARRELLEETGLERLSLDELRTYSSPDRDPRGRVISIAFLTIAPNLPIPVAGTDAVGARWLPVKVALGEGFLAFDHAEILRDAVERARKMLEDTTVAVAFCADEFTIGELRTVYEVVWGDVVDARNFNRKIKKTDGFVVATGEFRNTGVGRPAALYRAGPAKTLYPAILRRTMGSDEPE
jgi:8-oxo-dGTP diphosphatase